MDFYIGFFLVFFFFLQKQDTRKIFFFFFFFFFFLDYLTRKKQSRQCTINIKGNEKQALIVTFLIVYKNQQHISRTEGAYFLIKFRIKRSIKDLSLIHISEPTRPLYISYAVFCLKKKKKKYKHLCKI
eukprot:TRINITY_DN5406_c0_g1_i5.p2 TRINITY_DN5406_c0_g1~~TRINITY_DN5406_c0_g1_i5.p2  ORF type:complete len:128 (+),score=42.72 TRINITY_DN5406_c0_g1_i5:105-488(+)